jgi:hypothetical protein
VIYDESISLAGEDLIHRLGANGKSLVTDLLYAAGENSRSDTQATLLQNRQREMRCAIMESEMNCGTLLL